MEQESFLSASSSSAQVEIDLQKAYRPDLRKAFRGDKTTGHGRAGSKEKFKAMSESTQDDSRGTRKTSIARSVHSLFKDVVISAEGLPHFQNGAADYQTYLQRAVQMGGEIMDVSLPQTEDEEIRYEGE